MGTLECTEFSAHPSVLSVNILQFCWAARNTIPPSACGAHGIKLASNLQGSCHGFPETPWESKSQGYVTVTLPLLPASAFPAVRKTNRSGSLVSYASVPFNGSYSPVWCSVPRFPSLSNLVYWHLLEHSLDGGTAGRKVCTHTRKQSRTTR
jgi:hypothetical protein